MLRQGHALTAPDLQRHEVSHMYDLIALALGATRDAGELAKGRGARAARLAAVRADILANLGQVRLSPALMARRHGITGRQIHRLFSSAGKTFTEFVMAARLDRAHELLASPSYAHRSISEIAHGVGFGELTTFNRAFRRRFGDTPSALRAGVRRFDA